SCPSAPLAPKYTNWRDIRWPLITRPVDSLPQAIASGPFEYNSLAHIRPLLFLPLAGTDLSRTGAEGLQLGAMTILTDEMQKHLITAFGLYGDVSNRFSYAVEYENNQFLPNMFVGTADVVEFRDVLQDISYYEHRRSYNLGLNFTIHTPN